MFTLFVLEVAVADRPPVVVLSVVVVVWWSARTPEASTTSGSDVMGLHVRAPFSLNELWTTPCVLGVAT